MTNNTLLLLSLAAFFGGAAGIVCPGGGLECTVACCGSVGNGYYCCSEVPVQVALFPYHHWGLVIGMLILGIILSCVLSLLACFCCPGCLWYRHRRIGRDDGYYAEPFGFPTTVIFTSQPPHFPPNDLRGWNVPSTTSPPPGYSHVGASSSRSSQKSRVRFDNETAVKKT